MIWLCRKLYIYMTLGHILSFHLKTKTLVTLRQIGVGGISVYSCITVLTRYRSGIYCILLHTRNRIPIIPCIKWLHAPGSKLLHCFIFLAKPVKVIRQRKAYKKRCLGEMVVPSQLLIAWKWQHTRLLFTMLKIIFSISSPFIQQTKYLKLVLSRLIQKKNIQLLESLWWLFVGKK